MSGEVIDFFIEKLHDLTDCQIYILQGNHDYSKQFKSIIKPLSRFKNITVIDNKIEIELYTNRCLFLPYRYTAKEDYANIEGIFDYIFGHITDPQDQFSDEGIEIKVKGKKIYGHTHLGNDRCLGVPFVTRKGEENNKFRLARIFEDKRFEYLKLPKFFDYVEIDYNEDISKIVLPMNYQLIINNAINRKLAREKFREHKIYEINVITEQLKFDELSENIETDLKKKDLYSYYCDWVKEAKPEKEVHIILDSLLQK
jgi:hypothetical protein